MIRNHSQLLPALSCSIICDKIESAISCGVSAPKSSPIGEMTLLSSSSEIPDDLSEDRVVYQRLELPITPMDLASVFSR